MALNGIPTSLLFACSENSVRSPMAEALAKRLYGQAAYIDSVGVRASEVDTFAAAALDEVGSDVLFDLTDVLISGFTAPAGRDLAVGGPAGLCEMVQDAATNPKKAKTLCKVLTNVDKAVKVGKTEKRDKLLAMFRTKLDKEVGVSIGTDDAAAISGLTFFLTEDEGLFVIQHGYWKQALTTAIGRDPTR